jgi:hypothetical protein
MKTLLLIASFCINCLVFVYGQQLIFNHNQRSFRITCEESDYALFNNEAFDSEIITSMNSVEVDSIIIVNDLRDSIYVFVKEKDLIAYCLKKNDAYYLLYAQSRAYDDFLTNYFNRDLNDDKKIEFVTFWGDESYSSINIYIVGNYGNFQKIFSYDFSRYVGDIGERVIIKKNKLYLAYGYPYKSRQVLKYGVIDFTKDITKEFYFKPISKINEEQWSSFIKE